MRNLKTFFLIAVAIGLFTSTAKNSWASKPSTQVYDQFAIEDKPLRTVKKNQPEESKSSVPTSPLVNVEDNHLLDQDDDGLEKLKIDTSELKDPDLEFETESVN